MGQYYSVVIEDVKKGERVFQPDLLKLMEHAYTDNRIAQAVTYELRNPVCVAWVGDYADDATDNPVLLKYWKTVWKDDKRDEPGRDEPEGYDTFDDKKFVINYDKEEYMDIAEYMRKCKDKKWDRAIFPVAILTSVGNGLGGGDFYPDDSSTKELIGAWAGNLLQITDEVPKGFKKISPVFREMRYSY
jgi:hypothetical protein